MKQALALSLAGFQGLGHSDSRERPVDRVGAAGAIQIARATEEMQNAFLCSLGVDLIAFKFGNRASSRADAIDRLAIALAWPRLHLHLRPRERTKVAAWTVQEWAIDMCPICHGAKEIPDRGVELEGRQPMKPCPPTTGCGGTGKRRYSDAERSEALGGNFDKAMAEAHGLIGRAEDLAVRTARQMLERWP
jgi:hypothetical protein